jgi:hypothetical protein
MTLVRVDRCLLLTSSVPDEMASTTWAQSSEWHCVGRRRYTAKSTPKCIPERTTNLHINMYECVWKSVIQYISHRYLPLVSKEGISLIFGRKLGVLGTHYRPQCIERYFG